MILYKLKRLFEGPIEKPKKRRGKKRNEREGMSPHHLRNVRNLRCSTKGCGALPPSDPHHCKRGTGERGMGLRSTDKWAIPLCRKHHHEVEMMGTQNEPEWMGNLSMALWANRDDFLMMEAVVAAYRWNL